MSNLSREQDNQVTKITGGNNCTCYKTSLSHTFRYLWTKLIQRQERAASMSVTSLTDTLASFLGIFYVKRMTLKIALKKFRAEVAPIGSVKKIHTTAVNTCHKLFKKLCWVINLSTLPLHHSHHFKMES